MKNVIKRKVNKKDTDSANIFLRALWARIRVGFGHLAWNYQGLTMPLGKHSKKLILGDIDIIDKPTEVSILFVSKGTINEICFESEFSEDDTNRLNKAIDEALNFENYLIKYSFEIYIQTDYPIANYKTEYFTIEECKNGANKISFNILGFDKVDCQTIAKEKADVFRDLLSTHCWRVIRFVKESIVLKDSGYNLEYIDEKDENEWDDEHAIYNGKILLSHALIKIIDYIFRVKKQSNQIIRFQNAARLFHNGLKIEYEYIRKPSEIDWFEWVQVNFISSLEILSINDDIDIETCKGCGQLKFSISKRVKELVRKYFPGREDILKMISSEYSKRSSLVHEGIHFSTKNYIGNSVPLIEESKNYVRNQIFINPNLKYLFGHIFKKYIERELINI